LSVIPKVYIDCKYIELIKPLAHLSSVSQ